jgi:hypothetical protein
MLQKTASARRSHSILGGKQNLQTGSGRDTLHWLFEILNKETASEYRSSLKATTRKAAHRNTLQSLMSGQMVLVMRVEMPYRSANWLSSKRLQISSMKQTLHRFPSGSTQSAWLLKDLSRCLSFVGWSNSTEGQIRFSSLIRGYSRSV